MENGENGNNNGSFSCVFRDIGNNNNNSKLDWNINNNNNDYTHHPTTPFPLLFNTTTTPPLAQHYHHYQPSLYAAAEGHQDPYLTCLKLGKRHYFEDGMGEEQVDGFAKIEKRGRSYGASSSSSGLSVPRCQVEGCHLALVNAKEYHRRHKVCEMHSKSPQVVVLGIQQRFCQQCSRFHVLSEFDDTKRSCRRRLAGHNERRRKSSSTDPISRNHINIQEQRSTNGRFSYASRSPGRALSLLSSKTNSWISPPDLSSRSSAALRELIAENRAAVLTRQLFLQQSWHHQTADEFGGNQNLALPHLPHQHQVFPDPVEWERFHEAGGQVTLDLMQEPSSAFGFLSGRSKPKDEEECCDIWKSLEGTHVV